MSNIIDRRNTGKNKSVTNRQRFLDRYKKKIQKQVEKYARKESMEDILKDDVEISVEPDATAEPTFERSRELGDIDYILTGNESLEKGDKIKKDKEEAGGSGAGSGEGDDPLEDEFIFTLTKEEFLDIYFRDMKLPSFIKKNLNKVIEWKRRRAGYTKEGIPPRLNLKKTFEQAIARKIATKAQGKKPRYFDDVDMRYDHFVYDPKPIKHAVMFCLMDVSASMGEREKELAKKFFILLYLFLHKTYENVELVFIRHTTVAQEVSEEKFFYGKWTGGTLVSPAMTTINDIMTERYDTENTNFYVAQASDGDNSPGDNDRLVAKLAEQILPKVQYYAFVQVDRTGFTDVWEYSLYNIYESLCQTHKNMARARVKFDEDVYPVLKELFSDDK